MRKLFFIIFIIIHCSRLNAQSSDTYQIEKLRDPDSLMTTITVDQLYQKEGQNLIKISVTDDLVLNDAHPVLGGFLKAYKEHRPVTISPDIIWLLICQGFGKHVNNNTDEFRDKFVDFQGQKELEVIYNLSPDANMGDFPCESVFPEFVDKIARYTGKKLTENLSADFTTTTPSLLIASQIMIMELSKKYFEYKVIPDTDQSTISWESVFPEFVDKISKYTDKRLRVNVSADFTKVPSSSIAYQTTMRAIVIGCGIPSIMIEGTVDDWKKVMMKLDYLSQYDIKWWVSDIKPVIQKIIDTKQGEKFDKNFWMNMVRFHREDVYGSYTDIDGWLLKFYPYYTDGKRADFKKLGSIRNLPSELTRVPFHFYLNSSEGASLKSYKMEFWSGFMGLTQKEYIYTLKPEIGWAINLLPPKDKYKQKDNLDSDEPIVVVFK